MTVSHDDDSSVVVIVEERRAAEESVVVVDEEDVSTSERAHLLEPDQQEDRPSTSEITPGEHDIEASASDDQTSPAMTAPAPSRKTGLFGFFNRYLGGGGGSSSSASSTEEPSGASDDIEKQASSSTSSNPVCLICLEPLSQADFASGEAIHLDCGCRGDLAVRHRECAVKWSQVKDDGRGGLPQCELCKKPVKNLPELPRRPSREREREQAGANVPVMTIEELMQGGGDHFEQFEQFVPSRADLAFDCVRVMWIAMIVSILFFDADMSLALITGMVAGIAYLTMLRVLYKQHYQALRAYAEAQRDASAAAFPRMVIRI